jgi:hypothetical protein
MSIQTQICGPVEFDDSKTQTKKFTAIWRGIAAKTICDTGVTITTHIVGKRDEES